MSSRAFRIALSGLMFVALVACGSNAQAGMTLTSAGTTKGFSLSTYADGFPNSGVGPVGIAFPTSGGVMVTSYATNEIVLFSSTADGQHYSSGTRLNPGLSRPAGLTSLNGVIYEADQGSGRVLQLNNNGTIARVVASIGNATGITVNPTNGHLFVSTGGAIFDLDPATSTVVNWTATHGNAGNGADGLTFSPDGSTLYAAIFDQSLVSYNVATGARNFSISVPGSDGTALGTGSLAGKIYANTTRGQLFEIDLTTQVSTLIATGGSRGDFVSVAPDGTLLLTQSDSILRLTPPSGGGFGGGPNPVPEPTSLTLLGVGGLCLVGYRRFQRTRQKTKQE